ncbi:MAG: potassium transporter Kup [Magnetococcales bacterium]|nr:potassium transporter Kup [Magnetococcales bacterium]
MPDHHSEHQQKERLFPLMVGAIGVVFGDIGTSPLYAIKEALGSEHAPIPTHDNVLGVVSLILWSAFIILTLKYQFFIMRASHQGEGGSLVLVELARKLTNNNPKLHRIIMFVGMIGVAFFFGDSVITPAISVLSAVEGLDVAMPALKPYIIPTTIGVLVLLFFFQGMGTAKIGRLFGPVCILWFLSIGVIGLKEIVRHPEILGALNPVYGIQFLISGQFGKTFVVLGSVFLAVTGAEALYADMGHFGKRAINWSWGAFVYPALIFNYLGQGALILGDPGTVRNPFFLSVPEWGLFPMIALATAATVIASQAVISGAFSATKQAIQLGYLPRLRVVHTSPTEFGQIYVPTTNWLLLIAVVFLVISFKSSDNLAAAYGIAVTITMIADTVLAFGIVLRLMFSWSWSKAILLIIPFLTVDLVFFGSNFLKIPDGGWFTLALGSSLLFFMSTWRKGQDLVRHAIHKQEIPLEPFLRQFESAFPTRAQGTAVFMTQNFSVAPSAFVELLRHNITMYEQVIFLSVLNDDRPYIDDANRIDVDVLFEKYYRVRIHFGFMETVDVSKVLSHCQLTEDETLDFENAWFFMGKAIFVAGNPPEMAKWRLRLFLDMFRFAESATVYFNLPPVRVVDLGTRIVLG